MESWFKKDFEHWQILVGKSLNLSIHRDIWHDVYSAAAAQQHTQNVLHIYNYNQIALYRASSVVALPLPFKHRVGYHWRTVHCAVNTTRISVERAGYKRKEQIFVNDPNLMTN